MCKFRLLAALIVSFLSLCAPLAASERVGVVLMHGKQSAPDQHGPLADAMAAAGYLVERPEMCWSHRRIYDHPYLECLREIDAAIERLKARGASSFVIAGHSLGANAALAYGARHRVRGVIALAPGHAAEFIAQRPQIAAATNRARMLVANGQGDMPMDFPDINGDVVISVRATPKTYLSFFGPDSPAVMPINAARLTAPLLCVAGSDDPIQRGRDYLFVKAPAHPLNRYVTVRASHFGTSAAAAEMVVGWLKLLADSDARRN
jgi:pimeloyl-ACP methyl ester carboxylesterase